MNHRLAASILVIGSATQLACSESKLAGPEAAGLRIDVTTSSASLGVNDTAVIRVYWRNVSAEPKAVTYDCGPQLFVARADGVPFYFPWAADSTCPGVSLVRTTFPANFTDSSQFIVAMRGTTPRSDHVSVCMPFWGECTALVVLPPGRYFAFARLRPMDSTPSLRSANVAINVP